MKTIATITRTAAEIKESLLPVLGLCPKTSNKRTMGALVIDIDGSSIKFRTFQRHTLFTATLVGRDTDELKPFTGFISPENLNFGAFDAHIKRGKTLITLTVALDGTNNTLHISAQHEHGVISIQDKQDETLPDYDEVRRLFEKGETTMNPDGFCCLSTKNFTTLLNAFKGVQNFNFSYAANQGKVKITTLRHCNVSFEAYIADCEREKSIEDTKDAAA